VLDAGTGSGVLAVAAARLGASFVAAVDLDPHAARTAAENASANAVDDRVHALAGPIGSTRGGFDVIVANVLPAVHAELASEIRRRARRYVIASGMLDADAPTVDAWYACPVKERRTRDGWSAQLMRIDRPEDAP
jgi:ribosomal protein L11 methyltransferase